MGHARVRLRLGVRQKISIAAVTTTVLAGPLAPLTLRQQVAAEDASPPALAVLPGNGSRSDTIVVTQAPPFTPSSRQLRQKNFSDVIAAISDSIKTTSPPPDEASGATPLTSVVIDLIRGTVPASTPRPANVVGQGIVEGAALVARGSSLPCDALRNFTSVNGSAVAIYMHQLDGFLHTAEYQPAIAVTSVLVGLLCLWDGPAIWHLLVTALAAVGAASIAKYEANAGGVFLGTFMEAAVALEVSLAMGFVVHRGFEGVQVLLGIILGVLGAYILGRWLLWWLLDMGAVFVLVWYSTGAGAGVALHTVLRRPVLAVLAPLLGGLLFTSGFGLLVGRGCVSLAKAMKSGYAPSLCAAWLPVGDNGYWDALLPLLGGVGASTLAWHSIWALTGAVVHSIAKNRFIAVLLLVAGIGFTALGSTAGYGCQALDLGCPSWWAPSSGLRWPLVGSGTWMLLSAGSAWSQLGKIEDELQARAFAVLNQTHNVHNHVLYSQVPAGAGGAMTMLPMTGTHMHTSLPGDISPRHRHRTGSWTSCS